MPPDQVLVPSLISSLQALPVPLSNQIMKRASFVNYDESRDVYHRQKVSRIVHAQSSVDSVSGKDFQMNRSNLSVTECADGNYEGGESVSCVNHTILFQFSIFSLGLAC